MSTVMGLFVGVVLLLFTSPFWLPIVEYGWRKLVKVSTWWAELWERLP